MGIDPCPLQPRQPRSWWPHTHGDRPNKKGQRRSAEVVAPYTWGETHSRSSYGSGGRGGRIHMEIDPCPIKPRQPRSWWTHTHGDRPNKKGQRRSAEGVAPYTWG